ncbi:hypothetical protein S245_063718, partial [Arachis hypogaea]
VVHQTIEVGTQTATTLKGQVSVLCQIHFRKGEIISYQIFDVSCHQVVQIEQMGRIVIELDSIQFSIKMASQLVKEIGKQ